MSVVSITSAQNVPHVGDVATVTLAFKASGVAADPGAFYVDVTKGDDTEVSYEYGVDPEITKDAGDGNYHATFALTVKGTWKVGARATGVGQTAEPVKFYVHPYDAKTTP